MKLTKAQRNLLAEVADGDHGCGENYPPAIILVKAGLLIWRAENTLDITAAGRAALEARDGR